jgi:hypothetical protein
MGLANRGHPLPNYRRGMSILDKVKNQPGMTVDDILNAFAEHEREEIYPPLHVVNVRFMRNESAEVGYIELRDGKAYPTALQESR